MWPNLLLEPKGGMLSADVWIILTVACMECDILYACLVCTTILFHLIATEAALAGSYSCSSLVIEVAMAVAALAVEW